MARNRKELAPLEIEMNHCQRSALMAAAHVIDREHALYGELDRQFESRELAAMELDAKKHPELAAMLEIATTLEPYCKAHRARLLAAASIVSAPNAFTDADWSRLIALAQTRCECVPPLNDDAKVSLTLPLTKKGRST